MKNWLLTALLIVAVPVQAAERAVVILDGSGSMWGQLDGKPKLEIARDTLAAVLSSAPADLELGLMAYGHRKQGDCGDIEMIVPPAAGTAGAIRDAAKAMKFLGKTPMTAAVQAAAKALRYTEDKATVILITDGLETCKADPCAVGAQLEKAGVNFTTHVIGFDLSREEGRQVACLAEATGGKYIQASNAQELGNALQATVAKTVEKDTKKALSLPKASVSPAPKVGIGAGLAVKWTGPKADNDYLDIVVPGEAAIAHELSYSYLDNSDDVTLRAPGKPGKYELRYIWEGPDKRHVLARAPFEVIESEVAIIAPASVAIGQAMRVAWKGPANKGDYLDVVPEGYKEVTGEIAYAYTDSGDPATIQAPTKAGQYQMRYVLEAPDGRKILHSVPLSVIEATASVDFPAKAQAGTAFTVFWRGPKAKGDYVDLVPAGKTETTGELAYFYTESSGDGETGQLKAPVDAGAYSVRYVLEGPGGRRVLASGPLDVFAANATLVAPDSVKVGGTVAVQWTGPNSEGNYVDLVPKAYAETTGELSYFYTHGSDGKTGTLTAPDKAGDYEIRFVLDGPGGRKILQRRGIRVE